MSSVEYNYYPKKVRVRGENSPLGRDVFERPQTISPPSTDTTVVWKDQQSLKTLEDDMGKGRFNVGRSEPRKRKRVDEDPSEPASQILGESSLNTKLEIPKKRFKSDTNETNLQDRLNVAKDQMPTEAPKKRKAVSDLESSSAPNKKPKLQPVEAQVSTSKPKYYGKTHAKLMKVKDFNDRERKLQALLSILRTVEGDIQTLKDKSWKTRISGETLKSKAEDEEEDLSSMMDSEEIPVKEVKLERKEHKKEQIMLVPIMQPVEAQVPTSKPKYYGKIHADLMKKVEESKNRERKLQDLFDLLESQKKDQSDPQAFLTVIRKVEGKIKTMKEKFWKTRMAGEILESKAEYMAEGLSSMMDYEEIPVKEVKLERKEHKKEQIQLVPFMQKSPSGPFPCAYVL